MPRRKLVMLGLLGAVTLSVPALAQQSGPSSTPYFPACTTVSKETSDNAHTLYNAGRVLYDEGNYDGAIEQFRQAYHRDCTKHDLLVIISRAYELKGDKVETVKALELYLERVPNAPDASIHRTKIENLKKQIAAQPPPPPPATATASTVTPPPPAEVREHTIPPWIVVGVGGAAIVTGIILIAIAPSTPPNCTSGSSTCTKGPNETPAQLSDDEKQAENHQNFPKIGGIVMGAGAVFVAGGLLWHFLEPTGPVSKASVTPSVGPGFAGLSLDGHF